MHDFTPMRALLGGSMIGAAASLLLLASGRIAGISGIFEGLLLPKRGELGWRVAFSAGLLLAGVAALAWAPGAIGHSPRALPTLAAAGVLVGVGTQLARGCTSGHGVCGISRFSARSIAATLTFIATGMLAVGMLHAFGGQ